MKVNRISAEVLLDSKSPNGARITSVIATIPRFILAELNTHRSFSRNSASSRAVPFEMMIQKCENERFIPIAWMKEHKGMQGSEYFNEKKSLQLDAQWNKMADAAIKGAIKLHNRFEDQVTKQMCNRALESYMYHKVLITSTEWENFFAQRADSAAEIHFKDFAEKLLVALNESTPTQLEYGEWHLPYADYKSLPKLETCFFGNEDVLYGLESLSNDFDKETLIRLKLSTARCARTSFDNFNGDTNYIDDVNLFKKLIDPGHMSPTEHQAFCTGYATFEGNFKGFAQFRKMIIGENKLDSRLIKK